MEVPATTDMIQEFKGNLEIPEIRVWCHPYYKGESGDDTYQIFDSFEEALTFIGEHPEAEKKPLIAFRGYEINLYGIEEAKNDGHK